MLFARPEVVRPLASVVAAAVLAAPLAAALPQTQPPAGSAPAKPPASSPPAKPAAAAPAGKAKDNVAPLAPVDGGWPRVVPTSVGTLTI